MKGREIVYVAEFAAMFLVWTTVVVTYHLMTHGNWRRSAEGRHVMGFGLTFVWLGVLILSNLFFREYPGRWIIGSVSYGLPTVFGVRQLVMIVRAQRAKRRTQIEAASRARLATSAAASEPPR